jgi:hypothetical protein
LVVVVVAVALVVQWPTDFLEDQVVAAEVADQQIQALLEQVFNLANH